MRVTHSLMKGKLLGKGAYSRCYAYNSSLSDSMYAVKVVRKTTQSESDINVYRSLEHKHIVRFRQLHKNRSKYYIVLDICVEVS